MLGLARYVVHGAGGGGNAPSLNFNFVDGSAFPSAITFSRASSATMFDSSGNLVYAPMNAIRNNTMVGAVAGTPGTMPNNWSVFTALTGLTRTLAVGTENGIAYLDIRLNGTPSAAGDYQWFEETTTQIAASSGQTWTHSAYYKLQAGTMNGISDFQIAVQERDAIGGFLGGTFTTQTTPSATTLRGAVTRTLNQATTAFVFPGFRLVLTGAAIDITLRIGMPQLELGSVAREVIATSGTAYQGPRLDYDPATLLALGLLIEEQRTNGIRNNTMQGAVAGTPGTPPTNWAVTGSPVNGLTRQIVSTGVENGLTYIDIRYFGTTTSASFHTIAPEIIGQIAATSGQTWTHTAYISLAGGSLANITTIEIGINEYSSVPAFLAGSTTNITPTSGSLNTRRQTHTRTLTNASTASVHPYILFTYGNGVAIDITLRIGLPQMEQGAFATSVIPTTTTATTRSADVASVNTLSPWYNAVEGTIVTQFTNRNPLIDAAPVTANDNTNNNRIGFDVTSTGFGRLVVDTLGALQVLAGTAGLVAGGNVKMAGAYKVNDFAISKDGGAVSTDTSGTVPTVTQLQIGNRVSALFLNSYIQRITYYPRRLTNAALQQITA